MKVSRRGFIAAIPLAAVIRPQDPFATLSGTMREVYSGTETAGIIVPVNLTLSDAIDVADIIKQLEPYERTTIPLDEWIKTNDF